MSSYKHECMVAYDEDGEILATHEQFGGYMSAEEMLREIIRLNWPEKLATITIAEVTPAERSEVAKDHKKWSMGKGMAKGRLQRKVPPGQGGENPGNGGKP